MSDRLPAVFLSHGAPPLVDSDVWVAELEAWARALPTPSAILVVSAHWEAAPLTIGSTDARTPLTYDFWGFPERFYDVTYAAPGAGRLAADVERLMRGAEPVRHDPDRRLDHGAYVPLTVMYPDADVPVLQISLPTLDPERLVSLGERLRPLRDDGVLIIGSGFTTHGLPFLHDWTPDAVPPGWSVDFDEWVSERMAAGDVDALIDFRAKAPGMPYAHPTIEHFAPLFVALGASDDPGQRPNQVIDGYWMGLAKRSVELV
ncbi:dioxygenase [Mycolicibacterium sp. PAM1]|uniref:Extradiol ring-cleavage dioxygenase, class III enzyme, subunit B n=1 Tax=Mycolicibacterium gilvum (strain PYR-GCK) TaxID=350054 RepID=A4T259_MYCGI|nr:class III extradiol ring-cleavage dioxygenase [Mycolicibacterium sp. PAM1]ABP45244.1 Extradiol ring-cleavage dioxygenase, class III enzyme, subunit B [Mycolicibacterium gilvum PYR-GCK]MBV5244476.1 dioxygenase [Mycolicibacterium sp. PAM1]